MSIRRVARKLTRTLLTPVELSRLLRSEQESGEAMARALRRAMSSRFSAEEQAWIDKIESQRKRLLQSTDTIPVDTFFTTSSTETAKGGSSGTAGSSVKGEDSEAVGSSVKGEDSETAGNSPEGDGSGTAGSSVKGEDSEAAGSSVKGEYSERAGDSAEGDGSGTAGSSVKGEDSEAAGSSVKGEDSETAGNSPEGDGSGTAGSSVKREDSEAAGNSPEGESPGKGEMSVKGERSKIENISDVTFASVKPSYGQMLYALDRNFKPQQCLEHGTCLAISSAFIASALQLNGGGSLVTFEGSASRSGYAQSVLKELELENIEHVVGPFQQTLVPQLKNYRALDFCYIDGHHDGKATVSYFESILPLLTEGAVVVIDDITWSGGMKEAWSEIKSREEVALSVDTYMMGICQIRRKPTTKQSYRIMYW